jgi:hypothetical protein
MASKVSFGWWNLENLYDPDGENFATLSASDKARWKGYSEVYPDKLSNIGSVIRKMNGNKGPDLLGVGEIFEETSLKELVETNLSDMGYEIVHHESRDLRGLDLAFLYRKDVLDLKKALTKSHTIMKRVPTRDIFEIHFDVRDGGARLTALGNHWPSRMEGTYETEPFRIMVAEQCSLIAGGMLSCDANAKILMLGDFNDEPFNRSMQEYLLAIRDRARVVGAKSYDRGASPTASRPFLYNVTWTSLGLPKAGTFYYSDSPSPWNWFDQVIVSKGLLAAEDVRLDEPSVEVFRPAEMVSRNGAPKPFRRGSNGKWTKGYSDHFPVVGEIVID